MLTNGTKRLIDAARDILVGKLPDPKSQVEQITIALIYKFMDDMDKQSEELGGKAKFFTGEYAKYAWSKIFDPRVSGHELVGLYGEAIQRMNHNPNIPQLFRNIFKNAYLPYRDPETLKSFLKAIGEFEYDHSEKLGDAFEYLLSVMGSQGDAGQFRTPRHIIDFIVEVVDPGKNETILDPACGTAGFLISSYKHILEENKKDGRVHLAPAQKKRLIENFSGYDISPDMVRLSLANMYLHGFKNPKIYEYDTLTSEEKWQEVFDVILANPPFMSPKGGIRPHKRFSVQAKRSEVLFVDYIAEHLTPNGRAAVIVPEGVVFKGDTAYKKLRKSLVDKNLLVGVISLPAGIFNPYSGIKTYILWVDKALAKKTDKILFVQIENDGFDLGAQRCPIKDNDLPRAYNVVMEYKHSLSTGKDFACDSLQFTKLVKKNEIAKNDKYSLRGEQYGITKVYKNAKWPMIGLGEVLDYEQPTSYIVKSTNYADKHKTPVLTAGKSFILGYTNESEGIFKKGLPVIIFDDFTTATKLVDFPFKVKSSAMKILHAKKNKANIKYIFYAIQNIDFESSTHKRYWISEYSKIKIPLPPLDVQEKIVSEIEGFEENIDHLNIAIGKTKQKIKDKIFDVWGEKTV